jgi:hypothetical protein
MPDAENSSDQPIPSTASPGVPEIVEHLQAELRSMRVLFNVVLLALIVVTASLFSFMLRELKVVRDQIRDNSNYIAEYNRKLKPWLDEFHSKLFAYSKLHTNFMPIMVKYFGATNVASATASAQPTQPASEPTTAAPDSARP